MLIVSQSWLIKPEFHKLSQFTCMRYNLHFVVKFLSVNIFWNRPSILSFFSFREIFWEQQKTDRAHITWFYRKGKLYNGSWS